jgi:hypothetical protein
MAGNRTCSLTITSFRYFSKGLKNGFAAPECTGAATALDIQLMLSFLK